MKNLYPLLILLFLSLSIYAQSPDKMSYQAVVRDANNTLVANQTVGMQISILQSTITGTVVYTETHSVDTNLNGLVSLEIGNGSSSDNFSEIDWSAGPYFIKTETDPTGGSSYTITGTSQLMSVPFALYATTSGSSQTNATNITNNTTAIETNTTAIELNTAKVGITTEQSNAITANTAKVGYTEAAVSANTDVVANTAKVGITTEQSDAITANTAKVGITTNQSDAITANTAKVGITSDQSDAITANTSKVGITTEQSDAITANTAKVGITTEQSDAITTNTAKVGITTDQSDAITANTAKVGITTEQSDAITDNTAKVGITTAQSNAITANTAKVGITTEQSDAITANTAKVGITTEQSDAITANTAKVGITTAQSDAITANTAKVGITTDQSDAITANTAKVVITTDQSDAIVANTAKVGITTSQADAIVANSSNIIAISFFSDCNNLTGIGSAPINLIDVDLGDNILTGFPILPSGAGAFYNNFGAAIDVPAPVPTSGRGYTYGEYMPYDGEIVGAAINLTSKSATGNPEPLAMKYFAACYGGGSPFITELIGEKASGADEGSIFYNTTGAVGFESVTGLIQPHPGVPAAIPFGSGSYIGIFVDNPSPSVDVVVSGTLYVKINN